MLRRVRVGAGDQHAVVRDLRARRPDLLPVDDELVAVALGACLQARQVGARAGLAEQLAPGMIADEDGADEASLQLVAARAR